MTWYPTARRMVTFSSTQESPARARLHSLPASQSCVDLSAAAFRESRAEQLSLHCRAEARGQPSFCHTTPPNIFAIGTAKAQGTMHALRSLRQASKAAIADGAGKIRCLSTAVKEVSFCVVEVALQRRVEGLTGY